MLTPERQNFGEHRVLSKDLTVVKESGRMNFLNLKAPELFATQGLLLLCRDGRTWLCEIGKITLCLMDE